MERGRRLTPLKTVGMSCLRIISPRRAMLQLHRYRSIGVVHIYLLAFDDVWLLIAIIHQTLAITTTSRSMERRSFVAYSHFQW